MSRRFLPTGSSPLRPEQLLDKHAELQLIEMNTSSQWKLPAAFANFSIIGRIACTDASDVKSGSLFPFTRFAGSEYDVEIEEAYHVLVAGEDPLGISVGRYAGRRRDLLKLVTPDCQYVRDTIDHKADGLVLDDSDDDRATLAGFR
jgi:hypothetical protein